MNEKIEALIAQLQWDARLSNGQFNIRVCPFCNNNNYKLYINVENGLWDCKVCGELGNLYQLKEKLNVTETTVSLQSAYTSSQTPDQIPNVSHMHYNLLNNEKFQDVLDYLVADRSFSIKALEQLQIGVALDAAGQKWISYPYFNEKNECTYVKYRTAPPSPKGFRGLKGRENPLYNIQALNQAESEIIMVEGEADTVALISQGITNVVGIPGANMKKADWIERLDAKPNLQIYLLYDNDSVGQKAAKEIAIRIGLNRCKNICLPEFGGKDINEWFTKGFSVEEFSSLKESSTTFKLDGVQNAAEILKELKEEFEGKGVEPTIKTPWESVNRIVGGFEWGDLIGFMAEGKAGKTTTALNFLDYLAFVGYPCFLYCNEMKGTRMIRKWVSKVTQTDDTPGASKMGVDAVNAAMEKLPEYKGDLLFGYTSNNIKVVFETIRQAVKLYGVKVVCFDNLQLLVKSEEHATQETSNITKRFKELAMELGILILLIIQPKRVKEGAIVSARDAYGSSAIEKDVDCMLCFHRNRVAVIKENDFVGYTESAENFEPMMLVRADLTRYAPGGSTTLYFDGATSTVKEISGDMLNKAPDTTGVEKVEV